MRPENAGSSRPGTPGRKPNKSVASRPVTDERKQIFLAELRRHGIIRAAARAASPHSESDAVASFYWHRKNDLEFAAAWDAALGEAVANVELEIHRRAVEGWEEPVYQKGELVGTVTKYSDRLLELRARGLMPEKYAVERRDVKVSGGLKHQHEHHHDGAVLTIKPEDVLLLPEEERETLLFLLGNIARERGETIDAAEEETDVQRLPG